MKLRFYLLGDTDSKNPSAIPKQHIQKWHDEDVITYLGSNNDVREFIKYAHAVVLPSYYKEGTKSVARSHGASNANHHDHNEWLQGIN